MVRQAYLYELLQGRMATWSYSSFKSWW